MVKKQSISKNLLFQFLYQIVILLIPMLLSPYLTRTLQETAIGVYSYTNSIAYYFVILSMLGISRYGQRVISENDDNDIKLRTTFWSLFFVHIVISIVSFLAYLLFVMIFVTSQKAIYFFQGLFVLSALFDITWLFYGLENFGNVVLKNLFIKIIECVLIFLYIHEPIDLWKYTLISTGSILVGQMVMIPQAIKILKPIKFTLSDIKVHIKPILIFSISVIASSLYTVFDKTLLGILTIKENVAFYEYSNNIVKVPRTIIGVIGTVMYPRACRLAARGDVNEQKKYINYSFGITSFIAMGAIFGLIAVSDLFAVIYFGKSFEVCGGIIKALAPLVYIIGIGEIIRTQYMIPNHMDKQFNVCIILNAIINIMCSLLLIPKLGIYGAVVGTLTAEIFGLVYQLYLCKKFIQVSAIIKSTTPFFIIGFFMLICIKIVSIWYNGSLFALAIQILIGILIYVIISFIYIILSKEEIGKTIFCKLMNK